MGDIRGVNNGLLDTYQLKSLDGLAEMDVTGMNITRNADGRLSITPARKLFTDFFHEERIRNDVAVFGPGFGIWHSILNGECSDSW